MLRFSNDYFFLWVENLLKKESIEKLKSSSHFLLIKNQKTISDEELLSFSD